MKNIFTTIYWLILTQLLKQYPQHYLFIFDIFRRNNALIEVGTELKREIKVKAHPFKFKINSTAIFFKY